MIIVGRTRVPEKIRKPSRSQVMENLKHLFSLPMNSAFANSMNSTFATIIRLRVTRTSRWLCGCLRSTENRGKNSICPACYFIFIKQDLIIKQAKCFSRYYLELLNSASLLICCLNFSRSSGLNLK